MPAADVDIDPQGEYFQENFSALSGQKCSPLLHESLPLWSVLCSPIAIQGRSLLRTKCKAKSQLGVLMEVACSPFNGYLVLVTIIICPAIPPQQKSVKLLEDREWGNVVIEIQPER